LNIKIDSLLSGAQKACGVTVIIDVFRCFTTEAVAFRNGAEKIILVSEIAQAISLRKEGYGDILVGEVGGIKPASFDYGNSPSQLAPDDFTGKTLIHSTRAGTVGVNAAVNADIIYGGSFAIAKATVKLIKRLNPDIVSLVAMGLEGKVRTDEDEQCALYLRNLLQGRNPSQESVKSLVMSCEESEKYVDSTLPQWPVEDRDMALDIDSHDFGILIKKENDLLTAYPDRV
jgi:2-phosphosulfolactate phosphatase